MMKDQRGLPPEFEARYEVGLGRLAVEIRARRHGRDLLVSVGGGDSHVGAVAIDSPGGGTQGEFYTDAMVVPGHKEEPMAREFASRLAAATGTTCAVVAGIHIDSATPEEIDTLVANARTGLDDLLEDLAD